MNADGKAFVVAAPFDNECLLLVFAVEQKIAKTVKVFPLMFCRIRYSSNNYIPVSRHIIVIHIVVMIVIRGVISLS